MKIYEYNASLLRVVDGDTVDALIDLGFSVWAKKRIRLYKIDAPETRTRDLEEKEQGFKTKERLTELLSANDGKFTLISHGVGKYGRCLGTIIINNVDINELLITEGLAKEYV
jgi:micrococcal nuclease|tara:strand:- start:1667 stop:2005 length:339 start_codon:yes stop_codon:yes gene_type:complete